MILVIRSGPLMSSLLSESGFLESSCLPQSRAVAPHRVKSGVRLFVKQMIGPVSLSP
jgi:hypothetical protein